MMATEPISAGEYDHRQKTLCNRLALLDANLRGSLHMARSFGAEAAGVRDQIRDLIAARMASIEQEETAS